MGMAVRRAGNAAQRLRLGGRLFARSATPELLDAVLDDDSCVGA
jgi:hypothetical protein